MTEEMRLAIEEEQREQENTPDLDIRMSFGIINEKSIDEYRNYKNKISKDKILSYLKNLEPIAACPAYEFDIFNESKQIPVVGLMKDGDFLFPAEFIYYYETYDIGIPLDYEEYLKNKI